MKAKFNFLVFCAATSIFIAVVRARFAFLEPALYTEDALWAGQGLTDGWIRTGWSAKGNYLVTGNVFDLWAASSASWIVSGSSIAYLPETIALVSILTFAAVPVLAFVALRRYVGDSLCFAMVVALSLIPVGDSTNEIFGRISNLGYSMMTIAVLAWIILLSNISCQSRIRSIILFTVLIFCSLMNPITIWFSLVMCGIALIRYKRIRSNVFWRVFIAAQSALVMITIYRELVAVNPVQTGKIVYSQLIEVLIARSLLYPVFFSIYDQLNDPIVVSIFVAAFLLATMIWFSNTTRKERLALCPIPIGLGLVTLLVPVGRPSLTQQLGNYDTTFPDRYFMAQNQLVIVFLVVALAFALRMTLCEHILRLVAAAAIVISFAWSAPQLLESDGTRFPIVLGSDWHEIVCANSSTNGATTLLPVYPSDWKIEIPRSELIAAQRAFDCASPKSKKPPV